MHHQITDTRSHVNKNKESKNDVPAIYFSNQI